jgi:hypothetical protein
MGSPLADPMAVWKEAKKRMEKMTPEEFGENLIKAGILTKAGNVAAPYKCVIEKIPRSKAK